jgi:hypothetical protein
MDRRHLGFVAVTVGLFVCVLAVGAPSSWASAPRRYVLRHPKREHCKAHYVRRVRTVKKRIHHHRRKVRQTVCIFAPPAPPSVPSTRTTPAPPLPPLPPVPSAPAELKLTATVTTLEVPPASEEACSVKSFVGGNSILCVYSVKLGVSSAEGQALNLPLPTLTFSNPGEPGKTWTVSSNGNTSFTLEIHWEHLTTFNVEATELIDPRYGVLASAPGKGRWSVYAGYAGTSAFAPSQSSPQGFASPFF